MSSYKRLPTVSIGMPVYNGEAFISGLCEWVEHCNASQPHRSHE